MYYKHSGRFSLGGLAAGLVVGGASALVLAYAYGAGLSRVPEAHLAVFATIAFGGLLGVATGFGLVWGHVRNKNLTAALTIVLTTLALYMSWAVWIQTAFQREDRRISWSKLAEHPRAIWSLMKFINHYGTWAFDNGNPTTGWALWAIWILEAALIVGVGTVAALGIVNRRPYCEACGQWCRRAVRLLLAPVPDLQQVRFQLENKDLRPLEALGSGLKTSDHFLVDLQSCKHCGQFHTLSGTQVSIQRKKFGQPTVSSNTIVRQLIVGPGEAQAIHHLAETLAQTPKLTAGKARGAAAGT